MAIACVLLLTWQNSRRINIPSGLLLTSNRACTYGHCAGGMERDKARVLAGHGRAHRLNGQGHDHPDAERDSQNQERL